VTALEVDQVSDCLSCWLIHAWVEWSQTVLLQLSVALVLAENIFLCSVIFGNFAENRLNSLEILPDAPESVLCVADFIL